MAVALFAAHTLRVASTSWFDLNYSIDPFENYQWLLVVIMPFGPIILDLQGFYRSPLNKTLWKSFVQILRTMIYLSILVSGCVIFLRRLRQGPGGPLPFRLLATGTRLGEGRRVGRRIGQRAAGGKVRERVLLAGVPQDIAALERSLTAEESMRLNIAARIDIENQPLSDLIAAMHEHAVARVIFAAGHSQLNRVEAAIGACEVEGVPAWLVANFIQTSIAKPDFDAFGERPMLVFRSTPDVSWALLFKRMIDAFGSLFLLVLLALPMLAVAIGVKLTSRGPSIFKQERAGKHGKPFVMYKLRSMSSAAEMHRAEFLPFNQMRCPGVNVEGRPRMPPVRT